MQTQKLFLTFSGKRSCMLLHKIVFTEDKSMTLDAVERTVTGVQIQQVESD